MLKIAVCDDNLFFAEQAKENIETILQNHSHPSVVSVFQAGSLLLDSGFFDIVFLDVEMNGLNGIETAQILRNQGNSCQIIFIPSYEQYVFSAFDVSAAHYLLKPVQPQKLEAVLLAAVEKSTKKNEQYYSIKYNSEMYRIPCSKICFIEVFGRKISVHTDDDVITFNGKLDEMEQALSDNFFRCHKSFLINLEKIKRYNKEAAELNNGKIVPIARRKYSDFGKAFLSFLNSKGGI